MTFKFRISILAVAICILTVPNVFPDGNIHIDGLFTFPFSWKKTDKNTKAWNGKVVGVADGDTITVMHEGKGQKIRLYGIDTPKKGQAFGKRAKQFTYSMAYGKTVEVDPKDVDRYRRTVGLVSVNGESLNKALINNGYAWVYRRYCRVSFCKDWLRYESAARCRKVGLWSEPNPIAPWEFRRGKKKR